MDDKDWRSLLRLMREGAVVPVVGSRLLLDGDGVTSLYAKVARKVLAANGKPELGDEPLPPFRELNAVVTRLKRVLKPQKVQDLYGDVDDALKELKAEGVPIPKALQQLAQITDFRLMVTLTPDDLLFRALLDENRAVNEVVHSPKLSTSEGSDLGDWTLPGSPLQLLYLFGKSKPTPLFAIHEEDFLEYAHNVIAHGSHAPDSFLGALRERNLLLIGCNFPDWLSRFVLRTTRKERLADQRDKREWLVERLADEDPFIGFLGAYSPDTEVLTNVDPAQFVDELHRRWMAEQVPADGASAKPAAEPEGLPQSALFFISYSRTNDLARAQKLHQVLRDLGVNDRQIWFDRKTLEPGAVFTQEISEGIRNCRYFVPLVSRAATDREQAFVFGEWEAATQQLPAMNRRYLVPLVVDAENRPEIYKEKSVTAWRERNINFGHAPDGEPDPATRDFLKGLVRESRQRG